MRYGKSKRVGTQIFTQMHTCVSEGIMADAFGRQPDRLGNGVRKKRNTPPSGGAFAKFDTRALLPTWAISNDVSGPRSGSYLRGSDYNAPPRSLRTPFVAERGSAHHLSPSGGIAPRGLVPSYRRSTWSATWLTDLCGPAGSYMRGLTASAGLAITCDLCPRVCLSFSQPTGYRSASTTECAGRCC
jgi:hypothetical protein